MFDANTFKDVQECRNGRKRVGPCESDWLQIAHKKQKQTCQFEPQGSELEPRSKIGAGWRHRAKLRSVRTLKSFLMLGFLSVLSTRSSRGIILYTEMASTLYSPMFEGVWGGL